MGNINFNPCRYLGHNNIFINQIIIIFLSYKAVQLMPCIFLTPCILYKISPVLRRCCLFLAIHEQKLNIQKRGNILSNQQKKVHRTITSCNSKKIKVEKSIQSPNSVSIEFNCCIYGTISNNQ